MKDDRSVRLLVPLDGSMPAEEPLEVASAIADVTSAEIHVLYVSRSAMAAHEVRRRARISDEWLPRLTLHHRAGHAAAEICRVAREIGAAAILLSSHGATSDMRVPAGHVTLGVLRDPPAPVYVVRSALRTSSQAHRLRHLRRILVPLDGTAEAAQSIEQASALAMQAGAKLLILHVVCARPEAMVAAPAYSDQYQYEMEAWQDEFIRSSFARTPRPPEVPAEVALRCGEPGDEITRYAAEEDCDLIVAAWGGRISPGRAVVVRTLLERTRCPLLFLRAGVPATLARRSSASAAGRRATRP